jgi:hypothetical protein
MNFLKKLFEKPKTPIVTKEILPEKNLNDLHQFDDVWIKFNDNVCEGWVTGRDGDTLSIVFSDIDNRLLETTFTIERPYNRQSMEQNKKVLYLTKKAAGIQ